MRNKRQLLCSVLCLGILLFLILHQLTNHGSQNITTPIHYYDRPMVISLQPLGDVPLLYSQETATSLEKKHEAQVVIEKSIPLPISSHVHIKTPRHRADSLLKFLKKSKHQKSDYIIGITTSVISTTEFMGKGQIKSPK